MPGRLYFDHAATTPVLPEACEAMGRALEAWANPSSPHADGRRSRAALEEARRGIADALGWRHDVILTSGASEAIQIVAARARMKRRVVGPTEHDAVIAAMDEGAEVLPVEMAGLVDLSALERMLAAEPALVAIQLVNNETGVIQPIDRVCQIVKRSGALLLCDCAQAAGKMPLPDADFIAISGHKFGGPPGAGALLVKDLAKLEPSGGQERGYRRGTENLPAAAGMAAALASRAFAEAMPGLDSLRQRLEQESLPSAGWSSRRMRLAWPPSAPTQCRSRECEPIGPVRPCRTVGIGGERLFIRKHEAEPRARRDGRPRRDRIVRDLRQLRALDKRGGCRTLPRRVVQDRRPCQGAGGMIYLDYQATTPVAPEVVKAMLPWIEEKFANPHSPSRWGHEAEAAIEVARKRVEEAIGLKGGSLAFTGSATEALNWALKGTVEKRRRDAAESSLSRPSTPQCSTLANGSRDRVST